LKAAWDDVLWAGGNSTRPDPRIYETRRSVVSASSHVSFA